MFKNIAVTVASMLILAACSATPSGRSNADYVTGEDMRGVEGAPVYSSDMKPVDDDTRMLRSEFIAEVGDRVYFDFDSASIDKSAQKRLTKIGNYVLESGLVDSITIEGHADERGTREYNLALGDRRAVSTKKFLVGLGVDPAIIETISYGKERPVDPRHNEEAWAKNRRAVIILN